MDFYTLKEAQEFLRANLEVGAPCPCCKQLVKLYKRKLNSGMARVLIHLYHIDQTKSGERWIKVTSEVLARGANPATMEYSKLKYWGLLEEKGEPGEDTKSAGYWRVTKQGRDFVEGIIYVPKYIYLYDGRLLRLSDERTSIHDALGDKFNYLELMGKK